MKLKFIKKMEGHRSPVNALAFTSDGKYAVSVAKNLFAIWDLQSLNYKGMFPDYSYGGSFYDLCPLELWIRNNVDDFELICADISLDNQLLATKSSEQAIYTFHISQDFNNWENIGHTQTTYAAGIYNSPINFFKTYNQLVKIRPNSHDFAIAWDCINIFSKQKGIVPAYRLHPHSDYVSSIDYNSDGSRFVSGGAEGKIILWDTNGYKVLRELLSHLCPVNTVRFVDSRELIVSGDDMGIIIFWDKSYNPVSIVNAHKGSLHLIAVHPAQKFMVTTGSDKVTKLWSLEDFKEISIIDNSTSLKSLAFSPDGKYLFLGEMSGKIQVYECCE